MTQMPLLLANWDGPPSRGYLNSLHNGATSGATRSTKLINLLDSPQRSYRKRSSCTHISAWTPGKEALRTVLNSQPLTHQHLRNFHILNHEPLNEPKIVRAKRSFHPKTHAFERAHLLWAEKAAPLPPKKNQRTKVGPEEKYTRAHLSTQDTHSCADLRVSPPQLCQGGPGN